MEKSILSEAIDFIRTFYTEIGKTELEIQDRIIEIEQEISQQGFYTHKFDELVYGARVAWRNSNRCIGRLFWNQLHIFDERHLDNEEEIFQALLRHLDYAFNVGKIRPAITIFKQQTDNQKIRIWNRQLFQYAGYQTTDRFVGDPASIQFTKACQELGWQGNGTDFDILPIVIQLEGKEPQWFELPEHLIFEVPIQHPEYDLFKPREIKWYALPFISDMRLEIGGIHYTAAPFNGWYMGTEIGSRNLADESRYNLLPLIAKNLDLNYQVNSSLWKDEALLALNIAVLHSFKKQHISIVDHHTAAQQFKTFEEKEASAGRDITGQWSWLVPPMSPATTHIYFKKYPNETHKPNYFQQKSKW